MIIYQVGVENEYWLLDHRGNILEAPIYDFPADEMGFLIELRSAWGMNASMIFHSISTELDFQRVKAAELGLRVECTAFKKVSKEWQDYIARKYNHVGMEDYTRNIYGIKKTHHTGFTNGRATAGCHIHFSRWDTERERYVGYTEEEIASMVQEMDKAFILEIKRVGRIEGEWEPKPYHGGFEYRSLPSTISIYQAAKKALEVNRKI